MKSYKFLEGVLHKIKNIENTLKVLNTSRLNIRDKIEQISLLEEIRHEIISHDLIKESLPKAFNEKKNKNDQTLKLVERMHKSSSIISVDLVKSFSEAKIECKNLWELSKSDISNLDELKERFTELVKLIREVASIKYQKLKCSKYDSLLAEYDSDIREKDIKEIFPKVGKFFSENISKIIEKQKKNKVINLQKVAIEKQIELGSIYSQQIGINLDEIHDYMNSSIKYNESNFCQGLFSLLRHSGYTAYQNYQAQSSINSQISGCIMHETQGLFMEKIIGRSQEFVEFIQPHIKEKFSTKSKINIKAIEVENLYSLFNKVDLSSFKNAGEFSLLAHVMLRTKLEQDLINGTLEVKDLHDAWLQGAKHYKIPIKAKNELDTYFQDEYWASGIIGYFPIKIIALIAAVQIFSLIKKDHSEFFNAIKKGDFSLLLGWLSQNVYNVEYSFSELLKKVTGKTLDVEGFISYVSEKNCLSQ
ncbi:MAG: Thermostable carboxypeptidase 1 [Wolbachia endosymbiont of Ctenocephalides orientis wCori]|nr:MAG: Thermostable carboxypeptidase 1 [Wolbachia endosymbiont of Ctenocephalides orientis wCori]